MDFVKGEKVLVTGGTGLLGTSLTRRLIALGAIVTSSRFERSPAVDLEPYYKRYDFTNYADCVDATAGQDYVLICAVQASGVTGMTDSPTSSILPNLAIHAGLLEACMQNGVERAVWVSSSTVYQEADHPIREDELNLNLPTFQLYQGVGWVYRYLEKLAKCYQDKSKLNIGVIRTTNIYGPYDHFDDQKSHVIPALIKRALRKEEPYVVWGNGHTVRDFIYVDDLVEGVLRVLKNDCNADPINISSGKPVSIRELVDIILKVCDHPVTPKYDSTKPTAVPYRVLDNSKADAILGLIHRTSLEDGIRKTVNWYTSLASRE